MSKIDSSEVIMITLSIAALTRESRIAPAVRKFWRGAGKTFGDIVAGIEEARTMASRYDDLARLSDAELAARGIARSDIPRIVIDGTLAR
jgi:hypothetical protein